MNDAAFQIGQVVSFARRPIGGHIPKGGFTVFRVVPLEGGLRSYRVRGKDGQERAFEESQLRAGSGAPLTQGLVATETAKAERPKKGRPRRAAPRIAAAPRRWSARSISVLQIK
jgi:hypothetical protein